MDSSKRKSKKKRVVIDETKNTVKQISKKSSSPAVEAVVITITEKTEPVVGGIDWDAIMSGENPFMDFLEEEPKEKKVTKERGYYNSLGQFVYYKKDQGKGRTYKKRRGSKRKTRRRIKGKK
jgi:hypothetical protein